MKIKYQPFIGGRVVPHVLCGTYRGHHVSKNISVSSGLDTPSAIASGYSTIWGIS